MDKQQQRIEELKLAGVLRKESNYRGKTVYLGASNVCIGPNVEIGEGTIILPNTTILGNTRIGMRCEIEPCIIENSSIDDETFIGISSRISNSYIGKNCKVWGVRMNQSEVGDDCTLNAASRLLWTKIGKRCKIRPNCNIEYVQFGDDCELQSGVVITGHKLEECELKKGKRTISISHGCKIGPATYIHGRVLVNPGAEIIRSEVENSFIGTGAKIHGARIQDSTVYIDSVVEEGAWVHENSIIHGACEIAQCEIVRSTLGYGTKAKHFSYIGDVKMGSGGNICAGTVFGNYDGKEEWGIDVGDGVFIGINSSLINKSVKTIGNEAFITPHSLITKAVEDHTAVMGETGKQIVVSWSSKKSEGDSDSWELFQILPSRKPAPKKNH